MFKALVLPVCLSYGSGMGPRFKTTVIETEGGFEQRNQVWQYERLEYEARYDTTLEVEYSHMMKFFKIMAGRAHTFLATDPLNYIAAAGEGKFVTYDEGSPTRTQMVKRISIDGYTADMLVTKPKSGTITLTGGGTINYATGQVTSGTPTEWTGEFYKHVRFDTDSIRPELLSRRRGTGGYIVGWEPLPIIEVRGANESIIADPYAGTGGLDPI